jgi:hypothetical protein
VWEGVALQLGECIGVVACVAGAVVNPREMFFCVGLLALLGVFVAPSPKYQPWQHLAENMTQEDEDIFGRFHAWAKMWSWQVGDRDIHYVGNSRSEGLYLAKRSDALLPKASQAYRDKKRRRIEQLDREAVERAATYDDREWQHMAEVWEHFFGYTQKMADAMYQALFVCVESELRGEKAVKRHVAKNFKVSETNLRQNWSRFEKVINV